jgi:hypothetical protein
LTVSNWNYLEQLIHSTAQVNKSSGSTDIWVGWLRLGGLRLPNRLKDSGRRRGLRRPQSHPTRGLILLSIEFITIVLGRWLARVMSFVQSATKQFEAVKADSISTYKSIDACLNKVDLLKKIETQIKVKPVQVVGFVAASTFLFFLFGFGSSAVWYEWCFYCFSRGE